MQDLYNKLIKLNNNIDSDLVVLNLTRLQNKRADLLTQSQQKDFWNNNIKAAQVNKDIAKIDNLIGPWLDLKKETQDAIELTNTFDDSLKEDLYRQYDLLLAQYSILKKDLLFCGEYDNHDVIMSIFAGAGGTDAQDWAEMLLKMYLKYIEQNSDLTVDIIDKSDGEEAGIKSCNLIVSGKLAYGKLKSEHGVHRLVRLSPFNADNLRQTSFARVEIIPKIDNPEEVSINENDLKIDVFRAGGHGGQSVNTTDSAVRVTHIPTNIVVVIQNERSQLQNKETAITIVKSKLLKLQEEQHQKNINDLKGPNEQAAWGNQIRSYVLHPYSMVKDLRTKYESSDTQAVLGGQIDGFIYAYLNQPRTNK